MSNKNIEESTLTIGSHKSETKDTNMYHISGLKPHERDSGFRIELNKEFADALESTSVPERQEATKSSLKEMYTDNMMADIRFYQDSYLIRNITVSSQGTGLDWHKEEDNHHIYYSHNVDTPEQALEIIAIFSKWVELGHTVLSLEIKE